jgi:hypothetical protein
MPARDDAADPAGGDAGLPGGLGGPPGGLGGDAGDPVVVAGGLLARYQDWGDAAALERAERLLRRVIATARRGDPALPLALATLGEVGIQRIRSADGGWSVDEAVELARSAADLMPAGDARWPTVRSNLGWALCQRYESTGRVADLEEGWRQAGAALAALDDDHPDRPGVLRNLAHAYRLRFHRHGHLPDLDEAVRLVRLALATATDPEDRRMHQSVLADCLAVRFIPVGDRADIDEAVRLYRELLTTLPPRHVDRVMVRATLASTLWLRHFRGGRPTDLHEATTLSEQVIEALPAYPRLRSLLLANHAAVLLGHFISEDSEPHVAQAVRAARQAVDAATEDDPRLAVHRANLANLVLMEARLARDPAGVEESIATGRAALAALSPGNPERARALGVLAEALRVRNMISSDPADLDAAVGLWRSAVASRVGPIEVRMTAARAWARAAGQTGDAVLAVEAYAAAIGLLPVLAWRGLDRSVQEQRLTQVVGLGSDAAAWALTAGQPRRAVELLEHGRQVLWSQAVQTRSDLSALTAVAPDLAAELDATRRVLDRDAMPQPVRGDIDLVVGAFGAVDGAVGTDGRRRLAEHWESLLDRARRLPGFADFLSAPSFDRLRQAAAGGPVVLVNTTKWRSDALVVTPTEVHPVALPWLDYDTAQRRAAALLAAQREAESSRDGLARAHWRNTLGSALRWLWDTIAEPVCAALDDILPAAGPDEAPPRLWWCPTGPLTMLPLHAAGRYGASPALAARRRPTVPARYVCSYTPGLGALLRARAAPAPAGPPRVFAVGLSQTPGQAPLPEVAEELRAVSTHLSGVRLLTGPAATRAAVLGALGGHSWAHFACHAIQDFDRPSASALHLVDGRLSVLDLAASPALAAGRDGGAGAPAAELAYLSACRTAAGGEVLPDEAIHLTAALQLAGYRHVIGSQWAVADRVAAQVAGDVYARIAGGAAGAGAAGAARALAAALVRVRRQRPDRPELWASLVHSGP